MIKSVADKYQNEETVFVRPITQKDIVTLPSLRTLCEKNQCGKYGTNWMCPPAVGTLEDLTHELRSCGDGILVQMIYQLEDAYDYEGWGKAFDLYNDKFRQIIEDVSQHIPRDQLLCLGGGACKVCDTCTMTSGEPCRHPDQAIASVEAYTVEVNPTVVNVGLKYNNGPHTVSNVGLILKRNK